jgi:hypothetical protein
MYARVALRHGDEALAGELVAEAMEQYRYVGDGRAMARMLILRAEIAMAHGDRDAAAIAQLQSLEMRIEMGDRPGVATGLERLAAVAPPEDDAQAARILGAADGLREAIGAPRPRDIQATHEETVAGLKARLGDAAYRSAWSAGRAASLDDVLVELGLRPLP